MIKHKPTGCRTNGQCSNKALHWYTYLVDGDGENYLQSTRASDEVSARKKVEKSIRVYGDIIIRLVKTSEPTNQTEQNK